MSETTTFAHYMQDHAETLEMYTKAIAKVHGPHHAEIIGVRKLYEEMKAKLDQGESDFDTEFEQLRELTSGYVAPTDTCQTTAACYKMLGKADLLYQEQ